MVIDKYGNLLCDLEKPSNWYIPETQKLITPPKKKKISNRLSLIKMCWDNLETELSLFSTRSVIIDDFRLFLKNIYMNKILVYWRLRWVESSSIRLSEEAGTCALHAEPPRLPSRDPAGSSVKRFRVRKSYKEVKFINICINFLTWIKSKRFRNAVSKWNTTAHWR